MAEHVQAMMKAALRDDLDGVKRALDKGARPDATISSNSQEGAVTALHIAAGRGCKNVLRYLVVSTEAGQDLEVEDGKGQTPLHCAALFGHADVVTFLLQRGADPDATNGLGETPLFIAARRDFEPCVRALVEKGKAKLEKRNNQDVTPLGQALASRREKSTAALLELGADRNAAITQHAIPLLHFAAGNGAELVRLMLEHPGAPQPVNVAATDGTIGLTAMHAAAEAGLRESAEILLRHGAPATVRDAHGRTPQELASQKGFADFAKWLGEEVNSGRDPAPPESRATTPVEGAEAAAAAPQSPSWLWRLFRPCVAAIGRRSPGAERVLREALGAPKARITVGGSSGAPPDPTQKVVQKRVKDLSERELNDLLSRWSEMSDEALKAEGVPQDLIERLRRERQFEGFKTVSAEGRGFKDDPAFKEKLKDPRITAALKEIWEGQSKGDNVPLQKYSDDEEVMFVMARLSKLQMIADNFGAAVTFN